MDEAAGGGGSVEVRVVDAARGVGWWSDAWTLFTRNTGLWIVLAIVMIVIFIALSLVPVVGGIVNTLVLPPFAASWMLAARKVEGGGTLEIGDLFAGFRDKLTPLLVLGALLLAGGLVIGIAAAALGLGAVLGGFAGGMHGSMSAMMAGFGAGMLAILVALALSLLLSMAIWFAPALVALRNVAPVDAMKASFSACVKNWLPFLVYSALYLVAAVIASIPLGLGWIVLTPVTLLAVYVSYKDIFGD
ncbi:MAG: BPSS1780 family membrane protein [Gemmatimonadota bacterium]